MVSMAQGVAAWVSTVHAHVHAVHAHGAREGYTLATNLGWCAILDIYFIHYPNPLCKGANLVWGYLEPILCL